MSEEKGGHKSDLGVLGSLLEAEDDPLLFLYDPKQKPKVVRCVELPIVSYSCVSHNNIGKSSECENTDIETKFSLVRPKVTSCVPLNKEQLEHLMSPQPVSLRNTENGKTKHEKTPNTVLRMMERHRENERLRHHSLNKSMKKVCAKIPVVDGVAKETKVVSMQRIISYICYLENTMSSLCSALNMTISQLKIPTNFLTEQWKDDFEEDEDIDKDTAITPAESHQMKCKSCANRIKEEYAEEASNLSKQSLSESEKVDNTPEKETEYKVEPEIGIDSTTEDHTYFDEQFLSSSASLDNFPDAFEMMRSPLGAKNKYVLSPNVKAMENATDAFVGIKNDSNHTQEQEAGDCCILRTISPEIVLPTSHPSSQTVSIESRINSPNLPTEDNHDFEPFLEYEAMKTPDKRHVYPKNKRKKYTPHRSPFHDLTNLDCFRSCTSDEEWEYLEENHVTHKSFAKRQKLKHKINKNSIDDDFLSYDPFVQKFHNTAITRRQKADAARRELEEKRAKNAVPKPERIDLRKTSWMNGFMMFSRINRRKFIEENPGVHTSHISKMMGYAWRQMTIEEKIPYKVKAKEFTEDLTSTTLAEKSSSNSNFSSEENSCESAPSLNYCPPFKQGAYPFVPDEDSVDLALSPHFKPLKLSGHQ